MYKFESTQGLVPVVTFDFTLILAHFLTLALKQVQFYLKQISVNIAPFIMLPVVCIAAVQE